MHKLGREVRFSINPFLPLDSLGHNSFASKPSGEGLAVFFELGVMLVGQVDPSTGFVVNVVDIDKSVRQYVVPLFAERIRKHYRRAEHIGLAELAELLKETQQQLAGKFGKAMLSELTLKLNPFRKIEIDCEDSRMIYFSEKFAFAATHKLWNCEFSDEKNQKVFGKCAGPTGHGHNYVVEVTVKMATGKDDFSISEFQKTIDTELIEVIDHKDLNIDVAHFSKTNPTVENITVFAWDNIVDKFADAALHCVTVWETDKTHCTYYG